ncbi:MULTISPECIES: NAD-dependent epimerase/dehydratase family protein [Methanoculleus]|uniref:NAD-dependent epimerase/dehydratase n=2 Tax=Methanoculleus TaxID=45989 RepID=A3CX55_METMJ|nr:MULTISPECIES: NAD-dependent epimerase/dehydratase family protein [Methanoculleus]ABN57955.1 NAD-dependent epimerase/dehydratase [Methanoculleus marisnigri JR1]MCC7556204.1 SDR family NAD(P)-dependent oxidoreductase [Methanoculleus marisnigri]UYU19338.1 SDR family NAD(P)-dependent oxidoreductase [Methanoculleus submarinus]
MHTDTSPTILITGGAGFIGSHLATELLQHGYQVRILDNLIPRVHGPERRRPDYLDRRAEVIVGDIRDTHRMKEALDGADAVIHLAAVVGERSSMYRLEKYMSVNTAGTAVLLEALLDQPVERLIVASSSAVYGEGLYCSYNGTVYPKIQRTPGEAARGGWEPRSPDGEVIYPLPTPETKEASPLSVYAISKHDQEEMCRLIGEVYGIPTTILRLFPVYGPHQGHLNPYSGMLTEYASRLLQDLPVLLFEDGYQQRDFVSVYDAVRAFRLALESPGAAGGTFNIASGRPCTFRTVAGLLAAITGRQHLAPEITGTSRTGDIRHCFADIGRAREVLGYEPEVTLEAGLLDLVAWVEAEIAGRRKVPVPVRAFGSSRLRV